ncbi:restriction endonuclease [Nitrosomonas communis]|uniref:Restriction endonuclease n=1 Tax=Nitrosomonas communis TaxID=44574 RepID=A0A1H2XV25_9PROT|nr:restriction endonuclease [Nitrosomonas communis]SDW96605.1 Restriction endonuclease [Nitrosomonas communis]
MFDVFTEEIEILVKDGIANLYWYKGDLHKAWLRSGVISSVKDEIVRLRGDDDQELSKRRQMDALYEQLRSGEYNRRLEVSRNFVRILIEQRTFTPQNEKHRIEVAERCALKLREILRQQQKDQEYRDSIRVSAEKASRETYDSKLGELREKFTEAHELPPQKKGYALEKLFTELMRISGLPVEESFKIEGEQFDGAIKYDGHYYLVELKWTTAKTEPKEIGHFFYKVGGELQARGLFIAMNGFSDGAISTLPKGRELKVMLLDGNHFANVIYGHYKFQELLEHAI